MISYIEGNLFDSPAKVIVNTVNTVGVMGKGIALEFKIRYPQMFEKYKSACEKHRLTIGKLMLIPEYDHLLLLFPTKENWRYPSKLEYIEKGLKRFRDFYAQRGITSIAFPKLGCGNGELNWDEVRPLMEKYLSDLPIDIYIYLNSIKQEVVEHKNPKEMQEWLRKNAKDLSFNGLFDDIKRQCSKEPYKFSYDEIYYNASYDKVLKIDSKDQEISYSEDELFIAWDKIRAKKLFTPNQEEIKFCLLCALLCSLGYLSQIKKHRSGKKINGFQVNEGLGRKYIFRGRSYNEFF